MERDALLAYGASNLIHERLYYSSDAYEVQFSVESLKPTVKFTLRGISGTSLD